MMTNSSACHDGRAPGPATKHRLKRRGVRCDDAQSSAPSSLQSWRGSGAERKLLRWTLVYDARAVRGDTSGRGLGAGRRLRWLRAPAHVAALLLPVQPGVSCAGKAA